MDLNHVSAFVRVVRDGSFTAAAKSLGLPKSSVSRSVAQLEQDLGVRLLFRTTRKLHLTDAGTAFYERVARALVDIEEASSTASDHQEKMRGQIRVTAPLDFGVWALASIIARFVKKHPGIEIDVALTGRIVDLVAEGFDLAVRAGPVRDESLIARRAGNVESGLYASSRYVARHGLPKTIDEVAKHKCIVFRPMVQSGVKLVSRSGVEEPVRMRGSISADDMSFIKKAILAGAGIGLVPDFLCGREERAGKVVRILPEWSLSGAQLNVVYPSARFVPQRVVAFRDFLIRELNTISRKCDGIREAKAPPSGVERAAFEDVAYEEAAIDGASSLVS